MSLFDAARHAVHQTYKETVESLTSVSNVSQFREKGVLTPNEFVAAGDLLVSKCPSWSWESGDASKAKDYLPKNKQFLVTRNVPCSRRVASLSTTVREMQMEDAEDNEWTETRLTGSDGRLASESNDVEDIDEDETPAAKVGPPATSPAAGGDGRAMVVDGEDDSDVPDLDDLELEEGDDVIPADPASLGAAGAGGDTAAVGKGSSGDEFVRVRSYTVSITYDKYYQVPRMWLFGYDEDGTPLRPAQVFEDMSADHAKKTVTLDPHPHLAGPSHASVHPCRHSVAIKRIIDMMEDGREASKAMRPDQALFLFLKFISSVIPTVEYDFTMDFDT